MSKTVFRPKEKPVNIQKDLICGGLSGVLTGLIFLIPQYLKVLKQAQADKPNISIIKLIKEENFRQKIIRGAISFPFLVGLVGAAQFACNDKIRDLYGKLPGIIASALSGALFLTPGDHYMLRQEKWNENFKQASKFLYKRNGFFVGYLGVALREAIFMTNMIYIGPKVGEIMHVLSGNREDNQASYYLWRFIGRSTSGIISTFISQPFDVAARHQQIRLGVNGERIGLFQMLTLLHQSHTSKTYQSFFTSAMDYPWFRGCLCRMWLGTFGAAVLAGFYQFFSSRYEQMIN